MMVKRKQRQQGVIAPVCLSVPPSLPPFLPPSLLPVHGRLFTVNLRVRTVCRCKIDLVLRELITLFGQLHGNLLVMTGYPHFFFSSWHWFVSASFIQSFFLSFIHTLAFLYSVYMRACVCMCMGGEWVWSSGMRLHEVRRASERRRQEECRRRGMLCHGKQPLGLYVPCDAGRGDVLVFYC